MFFYGTIDIQNYLFFHVSNITYFEFIVPDNRTPRDSLSQKTLSRSWENLSLSPHQNKVSKSPAMVASSPAEELLEPDDFSAEFVAKSLLKKFDDRKLPAASDLKWMVTEEQVPQMLLPLPNAWPVSPDDALYHNRLAMKEEDKNAANSHKNSMHVCLCVFIQMI